MVVPAESNRKRDRITALFDADKIVCAIEKAFYATCGPCNEDIAHAPANEVMSILEILLTTVCPVREGNYLNKRRSRLEGSAAEWK